MKKKIFFATLAALMLCNCSTQSDTLRYIPKGQTALTEW